VSIIYKEYGANAPIFGPDGRLLFGLAAGTNQIRNPRFEGGAAGIIGAGGAYPTHVAAFGGAAVGLPRTLSFGGPADPHMDWQTVGTAASAGQISDQLETRTQIAAVAGNTVVGTLLLSLPAGAPTNITSYAIQIRECSAAGAALTEQTTETISIASLTSSPQRFPVSRALTSANCAFVTLVLGANVTAAGATTGLLRVRAPQLELGSVATLPKLPPIGSPGPSTAGEDVMTAPWASLFPGDEWTIFGSATVDASVATVANALFSADNGNSANRMRLERLANTGNVRGALTIASVSSTTPVLAVNTAGQPLRYAISSQGGNLHFHVAGGLTETLIGVPPSIVAKWGQALGLSQSLVGTLGRHAILPYGIPPADLPAALAASGV
jgi:hypothetical protein